MKFSTEILLSIMAFIILGLIYTPIIKEVKTNPLMHSHVLINN